jgi:hypothetical protein
MGVASRIKFRTDEVEIITEPCTGRCTAVILIAPRAPPIFTSTEHHRQQSQYLTNQSIPSSPLPSPRPWACSRIVRSRKTCNSSRLTTPWICNYLGRRTRHGIFWRPIGNYCLILCTNSNNFGQGKYTCVVAGSSFHSDS